MRELGSERRRLTVRLWYTVPDMDWKIELVAIPVTDVDRAEAFYADQVGFNADHDTRSTRASVRAAHPAPLGVLHRAGRRDHPDAAGLAKGRECVVADVEAAGKSSSRTAWRRARSTFSRGARSSPSATPMAIPGRYSNCRHGYDREQSRPGLRPGPPGYAWKGRRGLVARTVPAARSRPRESTAHLPENRPLRQHSPHPPASQTQSPHRASTTTQHHPEPKPAGEP